MSEKSKNNSVQRRRGNRHLRPKFAKLKSPSYRKFLIKKAAVYSMLSLVCTAFLFLMSASTSPLYSDYCDGDSSIFMLIGKAVAQGRTLYADLFDHKGPILFYINALGYALTGSKTGVFAIQCVMLSAAAIFMYKTARVFTKTVRSVICVLITILAFASTISDGNLSEEYCMLFCIIPIYLSVKFIAKKPDSPHPPSYMFIYGFCFAVCAFIRVNNGVMICGIVLVTLVTDFMNGHVREALKNILFFSAGLASVSVPVCLFFLAKGTLSDMLFATFIFNFMYAAEGGAENTGGTVSIVLQRTLPILALIFISTVFSKRLGAKVASLITTVSVFAIMPMMLGYRYTHYFTTLIPLITLYCAVFFFIAGKRVTLLSSLLCLVMVLPLYSYFTTLPENVSHYSQKLYKQDNPTVYRDMHSDIHYSADALSRRIPPEERDSVFGYDVSAAWFLQADIIPCYRLFTLQEAWSEHYPEFGRQINQMLIDTPPKWIVIHNIDIIKSSQFLNTLYKSYELDCEYNYDLLYKRKN